MSVLTQPGLRRRKYFRVEPTRSRSFVYGRFGAAVSHRAAGGAFGKRALPLVMVTMSLRSLRATWSMKASVTRSGPMVLTSRTLHHAS